MVRCFCSAAARWKLRISGLTQDIVGVNTGFGGSADTRTLRVDELQSTLIRELHSGILASSSVTEDSALKSKKRPTVSHGIFLPLDRALPLGDENAATIMPEAWVRASILIRTNSLASGYSGVRPILITSMISLLRKDIVPIIPLRGSISASGDLMPLSYIGGLLQGKQGVKAWSGDRRTCRRRVVAADVALAESSLAPIRLGPKEGLAIVNGTAISTGAAALVMHDANSLAMLSQILTAMSVEALHGNRESFDPFFAEVRPHSGQIEVAHNIYFFLKDSRLVEYNHGLEEGSLRQDRYSLRTASQWLGPALEDLLLAYKQVTIECNSVTDNPLVDSKGSRMLHGGNFQAKTITSAMEKTRLALQTIGQMLFQQCTELMNPKMNYGLPPSLAADNPSTSFLMKPLDIMVAALQSELGFLANPIGSHVQCAEMGNQGLNSLALISARYSVNTLEVLSQLASAHILALCQALDLRAMHIRFLEAFEPVFRANTAKILAYALPQSQDLRTLHTQLWVQINKKLDQTANLDPHQRFPTVFESLESLVLGSLTASATSVSSLREWTACCSETAIEVFESSRKSCFAHPDPGPFIGTASRRIYDFVRGALLVPFVRTEVLEDDSTTGSFLSLIYHAIRNGNIYGPVMDCMAEANRDLDLSAQRNSKL